MEVYSSLDLLGEKLNKENSIQNTFLSFLGKLISFKEEYCEVNIQLPKLVYLRCIYYCEEIQKQTELPFEIPELISVVYHHYLKMYYEHNNSEKYYNWIVNSPFHQPDTIVNDNVRNVSYTLSNEKKVIKQSLCLSLKKRAALKGEILLAELDEIYGVSTTLEAFIEIMIITYINRTKKLSNRKVLQSFMQMVKDGA